MSNRNDTHHLVPPRQQGIQKDRVPIVEIRDQIPNVKKVIYEDPRGMRDYRVDEWFLFIGDLYEMGEELHRSEPDL